MSTIGRHTRGAPHWSVIVVPAVLTAALGLAFGHGFVASDDLRYAENARSLLPGSPYPRLFDTPTHHDSRIGMILPLAALLWLFDSQTLALSLLPLFGTIMTASLVAVLASRHWGNATGLTAGVAYALIPVVINLSTEYVPEPIASAELCFAALLVHSALLHEHSHGRRLAFAAGGMVGLAYLTTEVGALMLPVLLIHLAFAGRVRSLGIWLAAGTLSVLCAELLYHAAVHGDPLHRFLGTASYLSDPMVQGANSDLGYRLLKAYPSLFVYPGLALGIMGPLLVIGGIYGAVRWRESLLFLLWAGAILLFYNFMSASFTHYVALPVAARLIVPALAPLSILMAKSLVDAWQLGARRARERSARIVRAAALCGAASIAATSVLCMFLETRAHLTREAANNAVAVARFLDAHDSVTLITDRASARAIGFLRKPGARDQFLAFDEVGRFEGTRAAERQRGPVYVAINGPIVNQAQIVGHEYGGTMSLTRADRDALARLEVRGGAVVFEAHAPHRRIAEAILGIDVVGSLMGEYFHRVARSLAAQDSPIAAVRVLSFAVPESGEANGSDSGPGSPRVAPEALLGP